jgi:outer membrane lipoprotein-sorting protein
MFALPKALVLSITALVLAVPATSQEPTLDEVLDSYYEAIGGLEAWADVSSARFDGTLILPGGLEGELTMLVKRPRKLRTEFTLQGMTTVQAADGDTAWQVVPSMGKPDPEVMGDDQAKLTKEQADFDGPLVNWKEDGNTVQYEGIVEVEGARTHKLEVTLANGELRYYYLDAEHFLPLKLEVRTTIQDQLQEIDVIYGDYKEVDGVMLAHSIEQKPKGQTEGQVIIVESAQMNIELADEVFAMPGDGD